ncbi:hypothetical protein ACQP2F_44520 [Actinoplanes sp. CA-030573]|uniref:hypothetical protein n=1 Tax=Actinoplanes sp. CA-030573 TaxID=3239898 RepID=UPI003D8FB95D
MALGSRYKSAPGAGTLAALILVLVFGSPWYFDWVFKNADENSAGGWFLRLLAWPHWTFNSNDSLRDVIVGDLKAILLVLFTAIFLYMLPGNQLARARGTLSQFFAGWSAYIFAAAVAALLTGLFFTNPSLLNAFKLTGVGVTYGFFVGWIIGLATLGGRRGRS